MDEEDKRRLLERFRRQQRHHTSHEEELRRKAHKRQRGARLASDDDDDEATFQKMRRQPPTPPIAQGVAEPPRLQPNRAEFAATVTWLGRARARLLAPFGEVEAVLAPDLAAAQRCAIAVGDEVTVHERDGALPLVVRVAPRRSELARADGEHDGRHVLAANVDVAALVLAADRTRTGLVDRLRIALDGSGASLLVVVNKCDLPHDRDALQRAMAPYGAQGVPWCLVSAVRGDGLLELRAVIAGRTAAFVGHSGVGKSTLLNALDPTAERATGEVRERDGRGRHTTSASSLRRLPDGTQLVDTPGVRMFGLVAAADDAAAAFPDLAELAGDCRFRDCRHLHEPGCAVRRAVETGGLDAGRYAAYRRIVLPDG